MKHVIKEGSRYHVALWDSNGTHCSEKNCELNQIKKVCTPTNLGFKNATILSGCEIFSLCRTRYARSPLYEVEEN